MTKDTLNIKNKLLTNYQKRKAFVFTICLNFVQWVWHYFDYSVIICLIRMKWSQVLPKLSLTYPNLYLYPVLCSQSQAFLALWIRFVFFSPAPVERIFFHSCIFSLMLFQVLRMDLLLIFYLWNLHNHLSSATIQLEVTWKSNLKR